MAQPGPDTSVKDNWLATFESLLEVRARPGPLLHAPAVQALSTPVTRAGAARLQL